MEYTINQVSKMCGVSSRTLRYYDEINLLSPTRINSSNYRIYGRKEIDRLQLILFYREFEVPLLTIKNIIDDNNFDSTKALEEHRVNLESKICKYKKLVNTLDLTITSRKENVNMKDSDKFEGFKDKLISDNEEKYGDEVRDKYGDTNFDYSNKKIKKMTKEDHKKLEKLSLEVNETIKKAHEAGDTKGTLAIRACELHQKWIKFYWAQYSKEAHLGLVNMYVEDERFTAYYDEHCGVDSAQFLLAAMKHYLNTVSK